jgi:hypothetical protein
MDTQKQNDGTTTGPQKTGSAACCDSVLLTTCCPPGHKESCCGVDHDVAPRRCGCSGSPAAKTHSVRTGVTA